MRSGPVRVLLVDDHAVVLAGLTGILMREADIEVVGEAPDAESALSMLPAVRPDVVVLDHRLPGMQGDAFCRELERLGFAAGVVVLSSYLEREIVQACLQAGARGYVVKDVDSSELKRAIREVARGGRHIDPKVAARIKDGPARLDGRAAHSLRPVEIEILGHVAEGKTNPEIAEMLGVSRYTVAARLATIFRKLGVGQRAEAVAVAMRKGLISKEGPSRTGAARG